MVGISRLSPYTIIHQNRKTLPRNGVRNEFTLIFWIDEEKPCVSWTTPWVNFLCAFIGFFLSHPVNSLGYLHTVESTSENHCPNWMVFPSTPGAGAMPCGPHSCQVSCCPSFRLQRPLPTPSPQHLVQMPFPPDWTPVSWLPTFCLFTDCFHDLHHHHALYWDFRGSSVDFQSPEDSGILLQRSQVQTLVSKPRSYRSYRWAIIIINLNTTTLYW